MSHWADLKNHHLGQWALAYLAGAWLVWQVMDVMGDRWGLTQGLGRALDLMLIVGFFVTLVLAWYHGEKGRQRVSGPELLMIGGIFALSAVLLPVLWRPTDDSPDGSSVSEIVADAAPESVIPRASIAVLPFVNMSSDPEQDYFSDGLAEEILNVLSQISDLHVTSRSSAFSFKGQAIEIPEIAASLGVAHVLEDSVQKIGSRVRITAQLIEAATDRHLWSERFDREPELSDVFPVMDEIAALIVEALVSAMELETAPSVRESQVVSAEAYDLYLRGLSAFELGTTVAYRSARSYFEQAIALEPTYAVAYARLSRALRELGRVGRAEFPAAREAADEAIRLDPTIGLSYTVLSMIDEAEGRGREPLTLELREKAYELSPGDPYVAYQYARALEARGRMPESLPIFRKSVELAPLDVEQRYVFANYLTGRGLPTEGLREIERAIEIAPANPLAWVYKGVVTQQVGDLEAARTWLDEAVSRGGSVNIRFEAWYLLLNGQEEEALELALREFDAQGAPHIDQMLMQIVVADMIERGALDEAERFLLRYDDRLAEFVAGPVQTFVGFARPDADISYAIALQDVYKRAGRTAEADALADRLDFESMQGRLSTTQLEWTGWNYLTEARWQMRRGRHSEALSELEQAVELGFRTTYSWDPPWQFSIRDYFVFEDLREEPAR
ncbi:MAG: hypothetical protein BMS9Abin29_1970 [Gemmatimonadota bacterium]|nr:MAG: hypothetical protein BMS9Abin29_1970 [Gemmatimonadota bacterium]